MYYNCHACVSYFFESFKMELQIIEAQERKLALQEREVALLDKRVQLELKELERAEYWAKKLAGSDLVPKDFKNNPANCFIAIQWGKDLGLAPLQAVQNIAVINGRPALWGDAVPALVKASKQCEYMSVSFENNVATFKTKRVGEPEHVETFSKAMAEKAGLWGKQGPWSQHPERMLKNRARAFALRDVYPDILKGLYTAEELIDSLPIDMGNADVVSPINEVTQPIDAGFTLEFYPDEKFATSATQWKGLVESGKKTAHGLIDFLSAKINLTPQQKKTILSWELPAESNDLTAVDSANEDNDLTATDTVYENN